MQSVALSARAKRNVDLYGERENLRVWRGNRFTLTLIVIELAGGNLVLHLSEQNDRFIYMMKGSLQELSLKVMRFKNTRTSACTLIILFYVLIGVAILITQFLVQKQDFRLPDGDLVRCISIQSLVQRLPTPTTTWRMTPSMEPLDTRFPEVSEILSIREATQLVTSEKQVCPIGAIPIRSIRSIFPFIGIPERKAYPRMNSVLHLLLVDHNGRKFTSDSALWSSDHFDHKYAVADIVGPYRGTQGRLSIWQPHVRDNEFSLAQVWVSSHDVNGKIHSLEAGWQIYRELYSDSKPRLFVYWTADFYLTTGCYNLQCPGFIQVSSKWLLGGSFADVSTLASDFVYEIKISIFKDRATGDWWLQLNDDNVGYWPKRLFGPGAFSDMKTRIHWGGEIWHRLGHYTDTQMGNGIHPSSSGSQRIAYVRNLQVVNRWDNLLDPPDAITPFATHRECCDIKVRKIWNSGSSWGTFAYFGGPGFNADCVGIESPA